MRICSRCKVEKEDFKFYKDKRTKSGLYSACKECYLSNKKSSYSKITSEYFREYHKKYRIDHKDFIRARNKIGFLVSKGILIREPCEICGEIMSEAHHVDYSDVLNIKWLCKKHHGEEHRKINERNLNI